MRRYINGQISGDAGVWPMDWFQSTFGSRPIDRALSIGCGTGALERDLIRRGLARTIDAFDGSVTSVAIARERARADVRDGRIRYYVADFNRPALPLATYDAVFFHQSLHHVQKLEKLLAAVLRALKPRGLLYLDEAIGPSRHEWTERKLRPYQKIYEQLPADVRWFDYVPFPVEWNDLTEAVRSSEIVRQVRVGFEVEAFRGYGGNVLAVLFPALVAERVTPAIVEWLIGKDREAVERQRRHFHAVIVARPKRGVARQIARIRYFTEPKLKWLARKLVPLRPRMRRKRTLLHPPP